MFTVRYPNGFSIQYNTANFLWYNNSAWELYTKKDGTWIASIQLSSGAIVEATPACRTYNLVGNVPNESLDALRKEIASLKRKIQKQKGA